MPAQKSPFFVGPSSQPKAGPKAKSDEQIREEQRKNLSPFKRKLIDLLDRYALNPASEFAGGFLNVGPFTPREEGEKYLQSKSGIAGALTGNGLFELLGPMVAAGGVAVGGGKNLPKLREASRAMLEGIDLSKMPEWFPDWATYMLERYPRVFSHNTKIGPAEDFADKISERGRPTKGTNVVSRRGGRRLSEIRLNNDLPEGEKITPETAFHENWHTVQRREPSETFLDSYKYEQDRMGYDQNPFEVDARNAAANQAPKFEKWRDKYNPLIVKKLTNKQLSPDYGYVKRPYNLLPLDVYNEATFEPGILKTNPMDVPIGEGSRRSDWIDLAQEWKTSQTPVFNLGRKKKPIQFPKTKSPFQVGPSSGNAK